MYNKGTKIAILKIGGLRSQLNKNREIKVHLNLIKNINYLNKNINMLEHFFLELC